MYDEELELKLRLLKLSEKLYGKMHYNVNMARYNLATAYIHTGEFDKCIELRKQAYEWFLSQLGEKNSSTLLAMSALAADYERCGETEKALELTERVYRLRYEMFGETKRETLYSYIRLGNCYFECHKIYQAMTVAQKATEICENIGIKDSSEYCSARSLYARICNETEQYSSALEATKEIEGICCDKDILQLANTYNIMADTLCHSGDYVNGLAYQMRDVDINTEAFGENHRYTIAEKYELAGCYFDCRMYSRSLELLQQLEQIGEEKYISASDMYYRKALLARALSATGEDVEGEAVINTLLNDIDESVGEDDCSDIYYAAAEIYFNSGKYPTALKYINKSLQLRIKIYPENARTLLRTYDLLKKIERKLKDETV
jgi:tetratricopeptide (TPR) repeat protein